MDAMKEIMYRKTIFSLLRETKKQSNRVIRFILVCAGLTLDLTVNIREEYLSRLIKFRGIKRAV